MKSVVEIGLELMSPTSVPDPTDPTAFMYEDGNFSDFEPSNVTESGKGMYTCVSTWS